MEKKTNDLRSQLRATPIKKLKKRVDEDNEMVGGNGGNEYLNLEDGKTLKIRIFPAHPGVEDFYVPKKSYWLDVANRDGEIKRTTVLDSRMHGGTKLDLVDEYVKFAKKKWAKDSDKLDVLTGTGQNKNSLNPSYTWLCYASVVNGDEELRAKLWEFKKMVRDALNKLAFSEDEDEVIEVDPFTDPDKGLPVLVKYMRNPNKKKGENYYEVSFPKKVTERPLTDEEIEYFMSLKPLTEVLPKYGLRDFERALEGLQNFDDDNEIGLFEDDDWLERVEEVKAQYDETDDEKPKKSAKKAVKKQVEEDEDEDEEEDVKPAKKTSKKQDDDEEDELDDMDRDELKKYIKDNDLEVSVKKSMSDDDLRAAIREAMAKTEGSDEDEEEDELDDDEVKTDEEPDEEEDDEDEEEDEKPKSKLSLNDIKNKLAGRK